MKWTFTTGDFVRIALFTAIIAALGIVPVWLAPAFLGGVPISLQTLGVMMAGVVIGARLGFFAVLLLIFMVFFAPVLSGGRYGLSVFVGPSAGFLLGWLPAVVVTGWLYRVLPIASVFTRAVAASVIGCILVLYAFGVPVMAWRVPGMTFDKAVIVSLAFVPLDVAKAVAVGFIARMLERWEKPRGEEETGERTP